MRSRHQGAPLQGLRAGHPVGPYRLLEELGAGGMGVVWKAEGPTGLVALKLLHPHLAAQPAVVARFLREVEAGRRIRHPHVVATLDAGAIDVGDGSVPYLVMGYVAGTNLAARLRDGPLDEPTCLRLAHELSAALAAIHAEGIIHRDVKPSNVLLTPDGAATLSDLGLARLAEGALRLTQTGQFLGSIRYAAPEQFLGATTALDGRVDQYGLGVTLFEAATGTCPFQGDDVPSVCMEKLHGDPPWLRELVPSLSPFFEALVARLVARDAARRFDSFADVLTALERRVVPDVTTETFVLEAAAEDEWTGADAFVGRRDELVELGRLLASPGLVTVVGPGGVGKTRLARRAAAVDRRRWPGGLVFCDLTEARTSEAVCAAVAAALEVPLDGPDPAQRLRRALAARPDVLVVIDNFEHLVAYAAATVGAWISSGATLLLTSREPLRVPGERVVLLAPLGLPSDDASTAEQVCGHDAVHLFVNRAREAAPGFALGPDNAAHIARIVRGLDGLPLAIELVAARARVLTPEQLAARLHDRFRLAARVAGDRTGRHGTLRNAIAWSWELLDPTEQLALAQLTVFEGGFTIEAAEAVLDLGEDAPWAVDVIQSLVDKSLVWSRKPAGNLRLGLLASVHEFARPKLGAAVAVEARHGAWAARFGSADTLDSLRTTGGARTRDAIRSERGNLVVAAARAIARGDAEIATRAATAAISASSAFGPYRAGLELAEAVRPLLDDATSSARLEFLVRLSDLERRGGRVDQSLADVRRALVEARVVGDLRVEGIALGHRGTARLASGSLDDAETDLRESVSVLRQAGDHLHAAIFLGNLGLVHRFRGDGEPALACLNEALALHQEVGDDRSEAMVLGSIAVLHLDANRLGDAAPILELSLAVARRSGARSHEGLTLMNLGNVARLQGQLERAVGLYEEARAVHRKLGSPTHEAFADVNLALVHVLLGNWEQARQTARGVLTLVRGTREREAEAQAELTLAEVAAAQGRPEEARERGSRALAIAEEVGLVWLVASSRTLRARLALDADEPPRARAELEEVFEVLDRVGVPEVATEAHRVAASLALGTGRTAEALRHIEISEGTAREIGHVAAVALALCTRAEIEAASGDDAAATLAEAGDLVARLRLGPDSGLTRALARSLTRVEAS